MRSLLLIILMLLAERSFTQQRSFSVSMDMPAFMRVGDHLEIPLLISNNDTVEHKGSAQLLLFDPMTNKPIDGWLNNVFPFQYFSASPREIAELYFLVTIPVEFDKERIGWKWVINNDTIRSGMLNIYQQARPSAKTFATVDRSFFLLKEGKRIPVFAASDVHISDTLEVELNIRTANPNGINVTDPIPSNTRLLNGKANDNFIASFKTNKISYQLLVTHSGRANTGATMIRKGSAIAHINNITVIRSGRR